MEQHGLGRALTKPDSRMLSRIWGVMTNTSCLPSSLAQVEARQKLARCCP